MSYGAGNISESYARLRLANSPFHLLVPPSFKSLSKSGNPKMPAKLTAANYRFIQRALSNIILYIQLENKQIVLAEICEVIIDEAKSIEAIGMQYIENIKRLDAQETQDPDSDKEEEEKEDEEPDEDSEDTDEEKTKEQKEAKI
jgi:hypothetical protein